MATGENDYDFGLEAEVRGDRVMHEIVQRSLWGDEQVVSQDFINDLYAQIAELKREKEKLEAKLDETQQDLRVASADFESASAKYEKLASKG